jgi:N-acetylglucosaminyldiphosphoundecaprenol N-acetyl-beta-D-mannosaminyltransferase
MFDRSRIVSLYIHHLSFKESLDQVSLWGMQHKPGFVCFANVHMVIEAHNDPAFAQLLNEATLVLPDGKPVALACNWLYKKKQERVSGMDFMPAILAEADKLNARIFLYGSTEQVLEKLKQRVQAEFPGAAIAGTISPPFRQLSEEEMQRHIQTINDVAPNFVLLALGCPKQEKWMAKNYSRINAMLLGLGGAFPVMAGLQKRAPSWMQRLALEWLYRLGQEPRRMFRRYFYTNLYFIVLFTRELVRKKPAKNRL